jgi:hypothetical protein
LGDARTALRCEIAGDVGERDRNRTFMARSRSNENSRMTSATRHALTFTFCVDSFSMLVVAHGEMIAI